MRRDILLLLCCMATCIPGNQAYCFPSGPENCEFEIIRGTSRQFTFCNWSSDGGFYYLNLTSGIYLLLPNSKREARLTSRMECGKTKWTSSCLKFFYAFNTNGSIDLSVSVKYDGYAREEPPIWITSTAAAVNVWSTAVVPLRTNGNFQVVLKAVRARSRGDLLKANATVYLDMVEYYQDGRACQLSPAKAKPPQMRPVTITTTTITAIEEEEDNAGASVTAAVVVVVVVVVVAFTVVAALLVVFRRRLPCPRQKDGSRSSSPLPLPLPPPSPPPQLPRPPTPPRRPDYDVLGEGEPHVYQTKGQARVYDNDGRSRVYGNEGEPRVCENERESHVYENPDEEHYYLTVVA